MERTLFDMRGKAVAYMTEDYHGSLYLWDGTPIAYLYEGQHIYGINGRHLGWFINDILYNDAGERIGFTSRTCPVAIGRESAKAEKRPMEQIRPKWTAPPTPNLSFRFANQELADFLRGGQVMRYVSEAAAAEESA
jgi:hypothetical protein